MARLSLNEVVTRLFDSDDEDEEFGTLDSASEDEESQIYEEISAYAGEQSFSPESIVLLSESIAPQAIVDSELEGSLSSDEEEVVDRMEVTEEEQQSHCKLFL